MARPCLQPRGLLWTSLLTYRGRPFLRLTGRCSTPCCSCSLEKTRSPPITTFNIWWIFSPAGGRNDWVRRNPTRLTKSPSAHSASPRPMSLAFRISERSLPQTQKSCNIWTSNDRGSRRSVTAFSSTVFYKSDLPGENGSICLLRRLGRNFSLGAPSKEVRLDVVERGMVVAG